MYIVEDRWKHTFMKLDDARAFAMKTLEQEHPATKGGARETILITKHSFTDDRDSKIGIVCWGMVGSIKGNRYKPYWHDIVKDKDHPLNKDGSLARSWNAYYKR